MNITQSIVEIAEIADELIAFAVTITAIACAGYVVWTTARYQNTYRWGLE